MKVRVSAICVLLCLSACTPTWFDREIDFGPPTGVQTVRLCEFDEEGTPIPSSGAPLSSKADNEICELATVSELGSGAEEPRILLGWDDQSSYRKYANEAERRGLTLANCAKILGWQMPQPKVTQPDSPPAEEGNIEERLTKLKNLYDSGLITLEEYEYKQRKILEELWYLAN